MLQASKRRCRRLSCLVVLLASPCFAGREFVAGMGEQVVRDELLVGLQPGADIRQVLAAVEPQALARAVGNRSVYLLRVPAGTQATASKLLASHPLVEYVEPNRVRHANILPPNDTDLSQQWALTTVQAVQAWSYIPDHYLTAANPGTNRVSVAILDTGADCTHPDFMNQGGTSTDSAQGGQLSWSLSQAIVATTISSPACPWQDDHGHGTHTAGTIAAATNNGVGVASLGYPLQLIVYKVLDANGNGSDAAVAMAVYDAIGAGAQVISMSIGGDGYSQSMQSAIDYAWSHNVLVVAAAGNTGGTELIYPGDANHALGVAATDNTNTVAPWFSSGNWTKIAGPGVNILSTLPTYGSSLGANYGQLSGTSMSTPHVAALAGLLFMANPGISVAAVAQRIQQTAQNPNAGWNPNTGYGVIDAGAALTGVLNSATQGSLTGQVVDASSNFAINGAQVTAGGQSFTTALDSNTGDADGLFRIANLPPGTYSISVTAAGYASVNLQAVVVAGADTMLTIPLGGSLGEFTGTVTLNGVAVAGAAVAAVSNGQAYGTAVTNASGQYTLFVAPRTYTLTASAPNDINFTSGSQALSANGTVTVNLPLTSLGNISGQAVDANGVGVANAHIDFTGGNFSGGTTANASGNYSTYGLPAGTYTVTASASGYSSTSVSNVSVVAGISTLVDFQFSTGVALQSGLMGYWPLDENAGSVAYDQSGNGYNAALSNVGWTAQVYNSATFNGSNSLGLTGAIPFGQTFSVAAWVNSSLNGQSSFAAIAESSRSAGFYLGVDNTGTQYKFVVNGATQSTGTCGSSFGCAQAGTVGSGWHFVAGTYDGTTALLYVDGALAASDTAAAPANASRAVHMGESPESGSVWNGLLNDLRLYSRPLTASEISTLYGQAVPTLRLTKTADAASVPAGSPIGFTLVVNNSSGAAAQAATLTDTLPPGAGISWSINPSYSGPGTCEISNQTLTCAFGTLASAAAASVHVTSATAVPSCGTYSSTAMASAVNSGSVAALAGITVQCTTMGVSDTADSATVAAGSSIGYTVTGSNTGTGAASSATLSDPLPSGTGVNWSINPAYSGPGTCAISNQTLTCAFGTLAPNAGASVHVTSATAGGSCGAYSNLATAAASNASSVQASAIITVQCPALAATDTADAAAVAAGSSIGYTVTVSNTGTGAASSATLNDPLPSGTGVNWSINPAYSGPGTCAISSQTLTCAFGTLASNAAASVHVTSATASGSCGAYSNLATAAASNASSVQASASITVQCPALAATDTADSATVAAGGSIGYTVSVSNTGTGAANSATLSDPLPSGTGVNWSISPSYSGPGTCAISNQILTCSFGTLASNAAASVHVTSATAGELRALLEPGDRRG